MSQADAATRQLPTARGQVQYPGRCALVARDCKGSVHFVTGWMNSGSVGGVRVNAFASGGFLPEAVRGTVQEEMVHVADW